MSETEKKTAGPGSSEQLDNRVIPIMREAVALVQLVFFGRLKDKLAAEYGDWPPDEYRRLVGCIVNDLFGTPATDEDSRRFARTHLDTVETELHRMAEIIPDLLPLLTDALRMQTLCDNEEGLNSLPTLLRARALGILQEERPLPLPSTFMLAVRKLGAEQGLLEPMQATMPEEE